MPELPCHEYTCAMCGGEFHDCTTEADRVMLYQEEFSEEFRAVDTEMPVSICDDCYKKMVAELPPEQALAEHKDRLAGRSNRRRAK